MIMKIFISLMFLMSSICIAQQNTFNKEAELQKFVDRGGKYEEVIPGMFKLTYANCFNKKVFLTTPKSVKEHSNNINTTIINVWEIDTAVYAHKFKFSQRVDITNYFEDTVPIYDINANGFPEIYGVTRNNWPFGGQVDILEQDSIGMFIKSFSYDSTSLFVQGIGDINGDGIEEVHLRTTDTLNGKFYKTDSLGAFPTKFDFVFYYHPNQIGDERFGDFDKNGISDCLFIDMNTPSRIIVSTYQDSINNFSTVFELPIENDAPGGYAIGDFDQDGKTEIVFGTLLKKVYVIEAKGENEYQVVWQGDAPTYNAYMITSTGDIDGNGKPEFWVGGQDHLTGISTFWAYEANGQNTYIPIASIELRYLVSLYTNYLQASDLDSDGKEELIINIGNYLIMLKFTGQPNQHYFEIYYAKIGESTQPNASVLPSTIFDFNNDNRKDILFSLDLYNAPNISYILLRDTTAVSVENEENNLFGFQLIAIYPNPFNPSTTVKFVIGKPGSTIIKVYNSLGKEITTLINEYLPSGEKEITWDGKDNKGNTVSSGVYFTQMTAGSCRQTIKAV
jgi:hypothetical protein